MIIGKAKTTQTKEIVEIDVVDSLEDVGDDTVILRLEGRLFVATEMPTDYWEVTISE